MYIFKDITDEHSNKGKIINEKLVSLKPNNSDNTFINDNLKYSMGKLSIDVIIKH